MNEKQKIIKDRITEINDAMKEIEKNIETEYLAIPFYGRICECVDEIQHQLNLIKMKLKHK